MNVCCFTLALSKCPEMRSFQPTTYTRHWNLNTYIYTNQHINTCRHTLTHNKRTVPTGCGIITQPLQNDESGSNLPKERPAKSISILLLVHLVTLTLLLYRLGTKCSPYFSICNKQRRELNHHNQIQKFSVYFTSLAMWACVQRSWMIATEHVQSPIWAWHFSRKVVLIYWTQIAAPCLFPREDVKWRPCIREGLGSIPDQLSWLRFSTISLSCFQGMLRQQHLYQSNICISLFYLSYHQSPQLDKY